MVENQWLRAECRFGYNRHFMDKFVIRTPGYDSVNKNIRKAPPRIVFASGDAPRDHCRDYIQKGEANHG